MNIKKHFSSVMNGLNLLYGRNLTMSMGIILFIGIAVSISALLFFNTAAPTTIFITSGPSGSVYQKNAEKYKKILAKEGITLIIIPSDGSSDNLKRLVDAKFKVDVGFVQGGEAGNVKHENLVSLGSISYQPLMIFYRGKPKALLSEFKGLKLDIGPEGSGTRTISTALLKANGIEPNDQTTTFVTAPPDKSIQALLANDLDALFVMGDSTSTDLIRQLMRNSEINLYSFTQADGYTRRFNYLNKLELPKGGIDFGKNIPSDDVYLVGPTVELVARDSLHPALSDALLEAAREVHGGSGLFRKRGEFPVPLEHEFRISPDANRYYSSGKSFLYRTFPFWLASLISRILAFVVPIALLLIPGLKIAPVVYRWRIEQRIYPWYKVLVDLEREAFNPLANNSDIDELLHKLDHIESKVSKIKIPASFGDLFYGLRGHISFVRGQLLSVQSGMRQLDKQDDI